MENKKKIFEALQKFQSEIKPVKKDTENPFFKSTYADLTSIVESISGLLKKNNLCYTQTMQTGEKNILKTVLIHSESGESIESECPLILVKQDMQSLGSAITYARRYSLSAILGIVTDDDDDGNKSSGKNEHEFNAENSYSRAMKIVDECIQKLDFTRLQKIQKQWVDNEPAFQTTGTIETWKKGSNEIESALKTISAKIDAKETK